MLINQVFISPQGEGVKTGVMSIFVRFAGCNFAFDGHPCVWCDTAYSQGSKGIEYTVEKLVEKIDNLGQQYGTNEVVLTGGEPLYQNIDDFLRRIRWLYKITIQTNGSILVKHPWCYAMDIKCPSSGNDKYNRYDNFNLLEKDDQVKFVIANRVDYDFAKSIIRQNELRGRDFVTLFQSAWKTMKDETLINWMKKDALGWVRLSTQCQKVWYGDKRRDV